MSKYHAKKTVVDNITFASKREAERYLYLKSRLQAGEIHDLKLQPAFELRVDGGAVVGKYFADFQYCEGLKKIIEDVKGVKTPVYRLKKKIVEAVHNIKIVEV